MLTILSTDEVAHTNVHNLKAIVMHDPSVMVTSLSLDDAAELAASIIDFRCDNRAKGSLTRRNALRVRDELNDWLDALDPPVVDTTPVLSAEVLAKATSNAAATIAQIKGDALAKVVASGVPFVRASIRTSNAFVGVTTVKDARKAARSLVTA